jgi:hypothetical protein
LQDQRRASDARPKDRVPCSIGQPSRSVSVARSTAKVGRFDGRLGAGD